MEMPVINILKKLNLFELILVVGIIALNIISFIVTKETNWIGIISSITGVIGVVMGAKGHIILESEKICTTSKSRPPTVAAVSLPFQLNLTHRKENSKKGAQTRDVGDGILDVPCVKTPHQRTKCRNICRANKKTVK